MRDNQRKMTQENRDILLQLLDRYRALGISEQIDYEKSYMDSLIAGYGYLEAHGGNRNRTYRLK